MPSSYLTTLTDPVARLTYQFEVIPTASPTIYEYKQNAPVGLGVFFAHDISDSRIDDKTKLGDVNPEIFEQISGNPVGKFQYLGLRTPGPLDPASGDGIFARMGQNYYLFTNAITPPNIRYSYADPNAIFVLCFATGTSIQTVRGDVLVEDLSVGDAVVTASGAARPIRWIGRRALKCAHHPRPEAVWPIRILAHAFGDGLPARDLFLSPDHAVCVTVLSDVLIPVKHLLNDATVAQVPVEEITYWHVELDRHDILLAEGLPAESFLDTGVRAGFENGAEHMILHPDFAPLTLDDFCRPLVQNGPIVDAVRTQLIARAMALGWSLTNEDDLHVLADGVAIWPARDRALARFSLPADAREVRLVSRSFVPERVRVGAGDGRRLGVPVRSVSVTDRHGVMRALPIGSDLFSAGFSHLQDGAWRWTTGDAALPSALWAGCEGTVELVVETAPDRGTLSAWLAPVSSIDSVVLAA